MSTTQHEMISITCLGDKHRSYQADAYASELQASRHRRERTAKHAYFMRCEKRLSHAYGVIAVLGFFVIMLGVHVWQS